MHILGIHGHALTPKDRTIFFDEIVTPKYKYREHYLPILTVMQGLACRINELIGLTWENIDFENRIVTIDHGICYRSTWRKSDFLRSKRSL